MSRPSQEALARLVGMMPRHVDGVVALSRMMGAAVSEVAECKVHGGDAAPLVAVVAHVAGISPEDAWGLLDNASDDLITLRDAGKGVE